MRLAIINDLQHFFNRQLKWDKTHLALAQNSYLAIEVALGHAYKNRIYKNADRVLAFDQQIYQNSSTHKIELIPYPTKKDEAASLLIVEELILAKKIFGIIINKFSAHSFLYHLCLIAKKYQIPTIYDERLTSLPDGSFYFKHQQLADSPFIPDYLLCQGPPKNQLGIILSPHDLKSLFKYDEFSMDKAIECYQHFCQQKPKKIKSIIYLDQGIQTPLPTKKLNAPLPNLKNINDFINYLPIKHRSTYISNGQAESVEIIAKSFGQIKKMLTFKGHYFGSGNALAQSLSLESEPYFEVTKLQNPNEYNYPEVLSLVRRELATDSYQAIWVEPVLQKTMEKVPYEFLRGLRQLAGQYHLPLIYNETASQFYRYNDKFFFTSCFLELAPDAGFFFLSGEAAIIFADENFIQKHALPKFNDLNIDPLSISSYCHSFKNINRDLSKYKKTTKLFNQKLIDHLSTYDMDVIKIENGHGFFKGSIPPSLSKMFSHHGDRYIVCPSFNSMKEYLNS